MKLFFIKRKRVFIRRLKADGRRITREKIDKKNKIENPNKIENMNEKNIISNISIAEAMQKV